ncbi:MAG: glycosyltransferase family 39 protein [bacterium]|nr:glycosyltransferase family 39 protein [bacterium]
MKTLIEKFSKNVVMIIFGLITIYLATMTIISTCYADRRERAFYAFDSVLPILITELIIFILYYYIKKKGYTCKYKFKLNYFLLFAFILGCIYVFASRIQPSGDQRVVLDIAKQMHYGNYKEFEPDGYMQTYPQQVGLVLFYYFIGFVLGYRNIVAIQLINVVAYVIFIYCIYKIAMHLWKSEKIAMWTSILTVCFIPLLLLTSFIYGTMIGLAASTYALLKAMDFMENQRFKTGLACAVAAAIAMLAKKNYLIVVIAITLLLLLHSFCKKHIKAIAVIAIMIIASFSLGKAATVTMEKLTGITMGDGMPSVAWMTMGLQKGTRANGWYNEYSVKTYMNNNCDTEATAEVAKNDLINRLKEFNKDKLDAANFFTQKLASEWADPTFQCFHLVHNQTKLVRYEQAPRTVANRVIVYALTPYLNILESFVFLGLLMFAFFDFKKIKLWNLLPIVVFIGGFLFHFIWEAKGQYTVCYYVLLFPYCIKGYMEAFKKFDELIETRSSLGFKKQSFLTVVQGLRPICFILVIVISYKVVTLVSPLADYTVKNSNRIYNTYFMSKPITFKTIKGRCRIQAWDSNAYLDIVKDERTGSYNLFMNTEITDSERVNVINQANNLDIYFEDAHFSLNGIKLPKVDETKAQYVRNFYSTGSKWGISQNDDDSFAIKTPDGYCLTRTDDDNALIFEAEEPTSEAQKWRFIMLEPTSTK